MPRGNPPFPKLPQLTPAGRGQLVADLLARRLVEVAAPAVTVEPPVPPGPEARHGALGPRHGALKARRGVQEARRGAR